MINTTAKLLILSILW